MSHTVTRIEGGREGGEGREGGGRRKGGRRKRVRREEGLEGILFHKINTNQKVTPVGR